MSPFGQLHNAESSPRAVTIEGVRVAIVAESFLPQVNGVTNSVLRILEHLRAHGHEALVIAPGDSETPHEYQGHRVVSLASLAFPGYSDVRVSASPQWSIERTLAEFDPDVVHLAAPFVIG